MPHQPSAASQEITRLREPPDLYFDADVSALYAGLNASAIVTMP